MDLEDNLDREDHVEKVYYFSSGHDHVDEHKYVVQYHSRINYLQKKKILTVNIPQVIDSDVMHSSITDSAFMHVM